ncbi:MAG: fibronectin type III domain-containing protein, partial [bacterium]
ITSEQGWRNGEYLTLSGITSEDEGKRPYIEVIYSDVDSADLTAPEPVSGVSIEPDTSSITLNWTYPDISQSINADISGVKIMRREGIVPFDEQDGEFVAFFDDITGSSGTYTDTGLTTGQAYYYALYTYDNEHNYSSKVWIKGSPGSPAEAPVFDNPVVGQGTVSLSWNQVDGAEAYHVYREDSSGNIKLLDETRRDQDLSLLDHVTEGEYIYFLTAVNQYGEGPLSEKVSVFVNDPAAEVPDAPSELSGQGISGSEIELSWMDNSDTEFNFVLERQNDTGDWIEIVRTEENKTGYIDDNLLPATYYNYRIKAENSAGSSSYSSQISATTLDRPVEVTDISWEVISASHVKVKWQDTTNEDSYRVELFDIAAYNEPLESQTLSKNTNICYFVTLEPGKEYRVRVTSIKGENSIFTESDIIRTSMDSKGGLF